jgi:four helix bundle protein
MKESILKTKSFEFAIDVINLSKELNKQKEFVLSKQFLKSGTSIGANLREAKNAQSKSDFIHKLYISQKECDETMYWLELLCATNYIDVQTFDLMHNKSHGILKMLRSTILTNKQNLKI